jgi:hypothetical protein
MLAAVSSSWTLDTAHQLLSCSGNSKLQREPYSSFNHGTGATIWRRGICSGML